MVPLFTATCTTLSLSPSPFAIPNSRKFCTGFKGGWVVGVFPL